MSKKNKNKNFKISEQELNAPPINTIPDIIGGDFNYEENDIDLYQEIIDSSPKRDEKIRILFTTEASYLKTGFSTYLREVFKRLHQTGKYELAELGSYGQPARTHALAAQIPWKYYHNMPANATEEQEFQKDFRENQFGKWKLDYVLADFKPDIVLCHRDHWMDTHVLKSKLRDNCLVFWMPTVDGYPQKWEWLRDYGKVDRLMAYSYFGKRVLETQSRLPIARHMGSKQLDVHSVIQPGVDVDVFKPLANDEAFKVFNIDPKQYRFVGTVMRNQQRKLFDRIIQSFSTFKRRYPNESKNVNLLLHTSIPDVGWDIQECLLRAGVMQYTFLSYLCVQCSKFAIAKWSGSPIDCPFCGGQKTFRTPNTQVGFPDEQFRLIFNLMDVYIQGSIAEGDGMPVNEAKACGVPVLCSDYSALYEKARNGGAIPIQNDTLYTESETMQWRSLFDRQDLVKKLAKLFRDPKYREKLSRQARECAVKYYNWDLTAKKWEAAIDSAPIKDRSKTWNAPVEIKEYVEHRAPGNLSNEEFVEWCYKNILRRDGVDPDGMKTWRGVLENNQATRDQLEDHFRKLVDEENKAKLYKTNAKMLNPDPVERVKAQIEAYENGD